MFGRRQTRAGKDEPVLLAAALFVHGETLPSRQGNRHAAIRNVGIADELGQQIAGWSAHGEHRRHGPAENRRDPGHIDATAARIVTGSAATDLVGWANLISARGDVERRVHGQCDDHCRVPRCHRVLVPVRIRDHETGSRGLPTRARTQPCACESATPPTADHHQLGVLRLTNEPAGRLIADEASLHMHVGVLFLPAGKPFAQDLMSLALVLVPVHAQNREDCHVAPRVQRHQTYPAA